MADEPRVPPPPVPPSITHVTLPLELVNRTLTYLVQRPYGEVFDLIVALKDAGDESFRAQQEAR